MINVRFHFPFNEISSLASVQNFWYFNNLYSGAQEDLDLGVLQEKEMVVPSSWKSNSNYTEDLISLFHKEFIKEPFTSRALFVKEKGHHTDNALAFAFYISLYFSTVGTYLHTYKIYYTNQVYYLHTVETVEHY